VRHLIRLFALSLVMHPFPALTQSVAAERLKEAFAAYDRGDLDANEKLLAAAAEAAAREQNIQIEAQARRYLGGNLNQRSRYAEAEKELKAALPLIEKLNIPAELASINTTLGSVSYSLGNRDQARRYYEQALSIYASLNNRSAMARVHYSLSIFDRDKDHIQKGLELAREVGDRRTEAELLHSWADDAYATDGFDVAFERLNQARSILESLGDRNALARVLTSMGRLYRVHGHTDQAIPFYERARDLQRQSQDTLGVIQSMNAIAVSYNLLSRPKEALPIYEDALRLAKQTGSGLFIQVLTDGLASTYSNLKQYQKAADLLEESKTMTSRTSTTFLLLAAARLKLRQYDATLTAAGEGLQLDGALETLRELHALRAHALWKLGKASDALAEVRTAAESIEKARRALIPSDFMKQGFSETDRALTTLAVNVLLDSNQPREALAMAEQARSRAFLDLVAAKGLAPDAVATIPRLRTPGGANDLPSPAAAAPASDVDLLAMAKRLNSTIVAYWVSDEYTNIWTVSPAGHVGAARVDRGTSVLNNWIDEAFRSGQSGTKRGPKDVQLTSRAGDAILTARVNESAWKRLYDALIRPVRMNLPPKGKSRLTIIPSGPLFRLSFAALMDERGRYLIEDYALHYAPSAGVLSYTQKTKSETKDLPPRYVFVSNPSGMPPIDGGKRLPPLPGSDEEVRRISKLFAASDSVTTLRGAAADETSVRNAMESAKVIHLATHGIVSNDDPFASYLALGGGAGTSADGRLSADEIYKLKLQADLVVLSACRSGLGRITGDGVAGLARAFFYAGAASVVATLWDVADDPASQLVADFYRSLGPALQNDKGEALRTAQLRLLRSLRRGELQVETPFGKLALPEDPVLWAGFILLGEP
jgi:CHAT domain-containing protein/tetratricopeptide (TPR) repeat protein